MERPLFVQFLARLPLPKIKMLHVIEMSPFIRGQLALVIFNELHVVDHVFAICVSVLLLLVNVTVLLLN